jgi:hypothetical protein
VIQAADGSLYRTTGVGGDNKDRDGSAPGPIGCRTVFRVILNGVLTTLFSFDLETNLSGASSAALNGTVARCTVVSSSEITTTTHRGYHRPRRPMRPSVSCSPILDTSLTKP